MSYFTENKLTWCWYRSGYTSIFSFVCVFWLISNSQALSSKGVALRHKVVLYLTYINLQKPALQSWVYPRFDIITFITRAYRKYFLIGAAFYIEDSKLSAPFYSNSKLSDHTDNSYESVHLEKPETFSRGFNVEYQCPRPSTISHSRLETFWW
jgi:hypothetical protein